MRLPKKITRIMACMLSGAIAAGPAFSAQSVYRVYVPGLQPTTAPVSAPVSASSLIIATPSSAQLSAEVGSSSYADISLTASAPSALSFDTASLPPSIQLVSNTCSSSNSTQACAVRALYSPLTPESATYPLKWTSETQSGQIMLELAATPAFQPTSSQSIPHAIALLNYAHTLPGQGTWALSSNLPPSFTFVNNTLQGTPTSSGTYPLELTYSFNGTTTTHSTTLNVLEARADLSNPPDLHTTLGQPLIAQPINFVNKGSAPLLTSTAFSLAAPDITVSTSACPSLLQPAQSCSVLISYTPLSLATGVSTLTAQLLTPSNSAIKASNPLVIVNNQEAHSAGVATLAVPYSASSAYRFTTSPLAATVVVNEPLNIPLASYLSTAAQGATWTPSPALPPGLSLNPATGVLSGTSSQLLSPWTGSVAVTSPDGNAASVPLTLQWQQHSVVVSTSQLDFGAVDPQQPKSLAYLVHNNGHFSETIGTPVLYGATSASTLTTNCPSSLLPNQSCLVQVTFAPEDSNDSLSNAYVKFETSNTASLSLFSAAHASTTSAVPTVRVSAYATASTTVSVPPQELIINEPTSIDLAAYFSGVISGTATWALDSTPQGLSLNPVTGVLAGTPTLAPSSGSSTHTLTVSYRSSPLMPLQRLTSAVTFNAKDYSWTLSKPTLAFDQSIFENQSAHGWLNHAHDDSVIITNTGNQPLTISSATLSPSDHTLLSTFANLSPANGCSTTVAPGSSCTLHLTYTPSSEHAPISLPFTIATDRASKSVSLNLTAYNPLNLSTPAFEVYRGSYSKIDLSPLLTLGTALQPPLNSADVLWATPSPQLPSGLTLDQSTHTIKGLVLPSATSTTTTLTASYAYNTQTTPATFTVRDAVITVPSDSAASVWQTVPYTHTLTLTAPASNTHALVISPQTQLASTSHPDLNATASNNCASLAPGASCTLSVQLQAGPAPSILGAQSLVLNLTSQYNGQTLTTPIPLAIDVKNPLQLNTPSNLNLLTSHAIATVNYSSLASYLPATSTAPNLFTWALTNLPPGLAFNPATQQLSGTPSQAGTFTSELQVSYKGLTVSKPLTIQVADPLIETSAPSLDMGAIYLGTTATRSIAFTLPNGGTITSIPSPTLSATYASSSTTCSTGSKAPGYSCTLTLTAKPANVPPGPWASSATLATKGSSATIPLAMTIVNPLSLPDQEPWTLLSGQPHTLENFSSLLTDARNAAATTTWAISATNSSSATISSGTATLTAPQGSGTFTITATRNGASVSKTYSFTSIPWPWNHSTTPSAGFFGYKNNSAAVQTITNTSSRPISTVPQVPTITDLNTSDKITPSIAAQTCSSKTIAPNASCTITIAAVSQDTTTPFTAQSALRFYWAPQPQTKPTRTITFTQTSPSGSLPVAHPLSWAAVPPVLLAQNASFTSPLAPFLTNSANSAQTYAWSAQNLPPGVSINSATGLLSGSTSASPGTYTATVSVSYSSPYGLTLSATTPVTFNVVQLAVSATPLDFGLLYPESGLQSQQVTLTNTGTVPVAVQSLAFPSSAQGSLTADTSTCPTLALGASCSLTVSLTPGAMGVLASTGVATLSYSSVQAQSVVSAQAVIASPLLLTPSLPVAYDKTPYTTNLSPTLSHFFKGANPQPSSWSSAALPAGWTLSSSGVLTGTPSISAVPSFPITAQHDGYSVSATYPLAVQPLTLSAAAPLNFGLVYSSTGPKTLEIPITNTSSTALAHLSVSLNAPSPDLSASLIGCSNLAPTTSCTLRVAYNPLVPLDSYSNAVTLSYGVAAPTHTLSLPITATVQNPLSLTPAAPLAIKGLPYSYNLQGALTSAVESAPSSPAWTLSGSLPAGLTFNSTTGVLSGTPSTFEHKTLTLSATYKGNTITAPLSLATGEHKLVLSPSTIAPPALLQGSPSSSYPVTITNASTRADTLEPIGVSFYQGVPGLQLSAGHPNVAINNTNCATLLAPGTSCTAIISVNPTVLGSVNLAATTSAGSTTLETHKATATLSFSVINPLSLEPTTPPAGLVNAPYSLALGPLLSNSLSPAPAPSWSAQNLPKGLTLNASSGTISGTPLEDGDFSVIVSVTAGLSTISQTYPLRIVAVGVTATPNPLSYGTVATNWEQPSRTITLSNTTSWPQTLSLSIPSLPYLTLNPSSTCTTSLAPNSSCTLNLTYAPTTVAHDLAHNLLATASTSGFSRTTTVRITGTAVNPLSLVDGLPPAFVGIPFKHPLQNNLRPSPSDGLDLTGISWANSNPIINPLTGELSVTPLNTNPIKATAKVALRGNTASFAYIINPIQTTFSLTPNPASYDFGSLYANNGEATAAITLTNTGTHSAEITGQPSFSSNTSAHPFVIKTSTCGTEVAPGASCLLTVGYTPTSPAASIASTLRIPVGKYGFTTTTTSVPLTARVLNPLLFASTLVQPIVGIPHTQDFNPSITSLIDTVNPSQISWSVSSGSLPAGLSFNNGLLTGIAIDTNPTSATLSATYKGNTITRTFAFAPRVISASVSPSTVDLGLLYPGQVKTQNFSVVNTSSNQALTIETPPSSQTLPAGATLSTNCTQGRSLNPGAGCTVAIRYAPTAAAAPWTASFQLGVGRNGVSVQTLTATLTGAAPTAMTFAAVPNQQLSKGFPYSLNMRNYLTVAVNPSVSNTSITWTTSGTLPAGLTFSNGVISGKATTLTSASFQITASYAGSSATSNPFTLEVVEPVVFVPPPSEPSFYASALSPASQGAIFVDQSKTFATEWRVNAPATITATPYLTPGAVNAMQVVWHNCAAVGTQVPAGYTCQAIVQFSGTTSNIGNRSGLVRMTVGTGAIAYAQANAYFTGSVLNPLVIYPQEQIWGLAANTPLVPVSDVFVDRFPNGTPVTVTLTPDFDYRSYPSPSYASSTAPAYLANGYITQGPLAESRGIYKHTLTVTKHTSPPLTLSTPIEVRIRRHSEFSSVVAAVNGLWEGYPDNVIRYNLTNTHNIPITPVAEAGGWTEVDFNTSDSITSSAATDCLRPLSTGASCSYTRAVNPGNAGPNEQAVFGMRTTFRYAPQPTTKPSQTVLATHPITLPSSPGTPGGEPTFNAKGMSSRSTVGQTLVYQDLGPYQDPLDVAGPFYLVADASGCNDGIGAWTACMTGPYAYQTRMMRMPDHMAYPYVRTSRGGFRIFNAKTNDYNPPAPSVQVSVVSGQIALDGVSSQHVLDKAWQFSWSNGQLTANLEHHSKWPITRWNVTVPDSMLAKGYPSLNVALSGQFPSGKRYSYSKQGLVFRDSPLYRSDYATATRFLPGAPNLGQTCSAYSSFSFLNAGAPRHGYCSY